jgi:hypothetical protein
LSIYKCKCKLSSWLTLIVNVEVICLLCYYPLSHVLTGWYCTKSTKLIFKSFVHIIISSRPIKFNILSNSTMFRCQCHLQIDKDIYICIYSKFKLNNLTTQIIFTDYRKTSFCIVDIQLIYIHLKQDKCIINISNSEFCFFSSSD